MPEILIRSPQNSQTATPCLNFINTFRRKNEIQEKSGILAANQIQLKNKKWPKNDSNTDHISLKVSKMNSLHDFEWN